MTSHIKHSGLESRSTVRLEGHHRSDGHRRSSINDVAFSCDGYCIGSGASDQTLRIWDVYQISNSTTRAFSSSKELTKHTGAVNKIAWDPVNPKILASASSDKTVSPVGRARSVARDDPSPNPTPQLRIPKRPRFYLSRRESGI